MASLDLTEVERVLQKIGAGSTVPPGVCDGDRPNELTGGGAVTERIGRRRRKRKKRK
jgi:hypothetical protein